MVIYNCDEWSSKLALIKTDKLKRTILSTICQLQQLYTIYILYDKYT